MTVSSLFFDRHDPGRPFHHDFSILVIAGGSKFSAIFFRDQLDDFHFGGNRISNSHRGNKLDLVGKVNTAMSRKDVSEDVRK